MKLTIEIDLDKAGDEVSSILREIADDLARHGKGDSLKPSLGCQLYTTNRVVCGAVKVGDISNQGKPVKIGKYWYWKHGPFTGPRLSDAQLVEYGLEKS